ncbi:MAG: hypothetical protein Q4B22_07645 [Eubacteriales bacterium]|nr:hypothetical protein [Eubacteriales bacterium]
MFSPAFDWTLAIILFALAVVFFMGKGQGILELFGGKTNPAKKLKGEKSKKYQRAVAVFLVALGISEVGMATIHHPIMGMVSIGISVAALVGICVYLKKLY